MPAGPAQQQHPRLRVGLGTLTYNAKRHYGLRIERIHYLRTVEGDGRNAVSHCIKNTLAHDRLNASKLTGWVV